MFFEEHSHWTDAQHLQHSFLSWICAILFACQSPVAVGGPMSLNLHHHLDLTTNLSEAANLISHLHTNGGELGLHDVLCGCHHSVSQWTSTLLPILCQGPTAAPPMHHLEACPRTKRNHKGSKELDHAPNQARCWSAVPSSLLKPPSNPLRHAFLAWWWLLLLDGCSMIWLVPQTTLACCCCRCHSQKWVSCGGSLPQTVWAGAILSSVN